MIFKQLVLYFFLSGFALTIYGQDTVFNSVNTEGQKTGYWKKYYDNGKLRYEGRFEKDKPVGLMRKYYKGGLPQAIMNFGDNGNTAHAKLFYENGKIAAEGNYVNNVKDSTWLFYSFYNGRMAIMEDYSHGLKNGISLKYYDNGNVSEKTEWKKDIKDGVWEQYYENGVLRLRATYKNNLRDGLFETFSAEGKPSVKGLYKEGVMDGKWEYYKDNGDHDFEAEYIEGKMLPNEELEKRQEEFSRKIEENVGEFPESVDPDLR